MNKFDLKRSNIIIADNAYHPLLFKFKNIHPDIDIKIINKEEVLSKLVFSFKEGAIKALMHSNKLIEYTKAKKYLKLLRVSNYKDNKELSSIYEIVKDFIEVDPYGPLIFKDKNILLFEDDEDNELINILNINKLDHQLLSISDLSIKEANNNLEAYYFENKFEQFFYIFLDIRNKLIKDKSLINKIHILVEDSYDLFYIKILSNIFKIDTYINLSTPIFDLPEVKNKIKNLYRCKDFHFSEKNMALVGHQMLKKIVDDYELSSLPFNKGYINLLEIATSTNFTRQLLNKGIVVTNQYSFDLDSLVYITNFNSDSFFKVGKDNNVISDIEINKIHANPSYIFTALDKRLKANYIKYNNIVLLSRVKQHLNDNIYSSPLEKELNIKVKTINDIDSRKDIISNDKIHELMNEYDSYTSEASKVYNIDYLDKRHILKKINEYNSYDSSFKGISNNNLFNPKHYYITDLQQYIKCPFKYYLTKLIPELDQDKYAMYLGTLIHACLENINHEDYDFNKEFNKGKDAYIKQMKSDNHDITPLEETYIAIAFHWLNKIIPTIKERIDDIRNKGHLISLVNDAENKFAIKIKDETDNKEYEIHGCIDKILLTKNNHKNYFTLIDYKSGNSESFNPSLVFLCQSAQLPLYYLAVSDIDNVIHIDDGYYKDLSKITKGYTFGGFNIQHVYGSTFKHLFIDKDKSSKQTLLKNTKLNGLTLKDDDYYISMDANEESYSKSKNEPNAKHYINTKYAFKEFNKDESIFGSKSNVSKYNFNDLVNDAKKGIINTIKEINKCNFIIAPTSQDIKSNPFDANARLTCEYCPYADICYKNKKKVIKEYQTAIKEHFPTLDIKEDNADEI